MEKFKVQGNQDGMEVVGCNNGNGYGKTGHGKTCMFSVQGSEFV